MSQIRFKDKVVDSSCPTENRQQRTDVADAVPGSEAKSKSQSREFRRRSKSHSYSLHRIVNETARAWSIECLQYEIQEIISPASIKQAVEVQTEAEHIKRAESLQSEGDQQSEINLARGKQPEIATALNNIPQFKIPAHMPNRSKSAQEINKHVSDGVNKHSVDNKCDLKAKARENHGNEEPQQIRS